jgi:hypothetical protein
MAAQSAGAYTFQPGFGGCFSPSVSAQVNMASILRELFAKLGLIG